MEGGLSTQLQNTSIRTESSTKRIENIKWVIQIPRTGLAYRERTNQILITRTESNEEVLIQYPGKETARTEKHRPWDFFPRIKKSNGYSEDLDFQAIWDVLYEGLHLLAKDNQDWYAIIATLFYRMAFMNDHTLNSDSSKTNIRELSYDNTGQEVLLRDSTEEIAPWYKYSPNREILKRITEIVPLWGSMSFESFLHYNDLLAWNEDCKYYYRMQQTKPDTWIRETGRVNTLLTHLSIIGYLSGKIQFSEVCVKFARGQGVAPATRDEILKVCNGYVTK